MCSIDYLVDLYRCFSSPFAYVVRMDLFMQITCNQWSFKKYWAHGLKCMLLIFYAILAHRPPCTIHIHLTSISLIMPTQRIPKSTTCHTENPKIFQTQYLEFSSKLTTDSQTFQLPFSGVQSILFHPDGSIAIESCRGGDASQKHFPRLDGWCPDPVLIIKFIPGLISSFRSPPKVSD